MRGLLGAAEGIAVAYWHHREHDAASNSLAADRRNPSFPAKPAGARHRTLATAHSLMVAATEPTTVAHPHRRHPPAPTPTPSPTAKASCPA